MLQRLGHSNAAGTAPLVQEGAIATRLAAYPLCLCRKPLPSSASLSQKQRLFRADAGTFRGGR